MHSAVRNTITAGAVGTALLLPLFTAGTASAHVSTPAGPPPAAQPAPAPAPAEQAQGAYKVKAGDTIAKIAKAQGMRWDTLAELNGVKSPFVIYPGQVLKLSGSVSAPAAEQGHTSRADRPDPSASSAPAPAPAPAPSVGSGKGATAVAYALQQQREGDRYVYGANGTSSWDCSSLTQAAWKNAGVSIPRTSKAQAGAGVATTRDALKPGDLVVYFSPVSHVAMYIGDGQVVQALNAKSGLKVTSIDYAGKVSGYRSIG
jgi:cell wall-associated NlpC family hydrolase